MKEKIVTLTSDVKCRIYTGQKVPKDLLTALSVYRANGQEEGPTEYFGRIDPKKRYYISWNSESSHISLNNVTKKHKKPKVKIHEDKADVKPLKVKIKWHEGKYESTSTDNTNVFGPSGFIKIRREKVLEKIPLYHALDCRNYLVKYYGIKLIPYGDELPPIDVNKSIEMVTYEIHEDFVSSFVHCDSCYGIFLEYHEFPHYITLSSPETRGPLVIGKLLDNNYIELIGIEVPFGYTLFIPKNVVHNDWYVVGKITTTVTVDEESNTAFLRGFHDKAIYMSFLLNPVE
jgi:hypothetical protein